MDTDTVVYRIGNRRGFLIWSAICAAFVVGLAISIPLNAPAAGALLLPGLLGLVMGPLLLNFAAGRTSISREGLCTGPLFGRRACRWDEVASVHSERHTVRASQITVVIVELADGEGSSSRPLRIGPGTTPGYRRRSPWRRTTGLVRRPAGPEKPGS